MERREDTDDEDGTHTYDAQYYNVLKLFYVHGLHIEHNLM